MKRKSRRWLGRIAVAVGVAASIVVAVAEAEALAQPPSSGSGAGSAAGSGSGSSGSAASRARNGVKISPRSVPLRNFGRIEKPEVLIPRILEEHNKIRADKKLSLFVPNAKLAAAAQKHA